MSRRLPWAHAPFLMAAILCLVSATPLAAADTPLVAVAANLRFAMPELIGAFRKSHGESVRPNYGSSSNLRRRITQNAPYELFPSADECYVRVLNQGGHTRNAGRRYARGRMTIVTGAIYDRVQAFDDQAAGAMSLLLLVTSFVAIALVYALAGRRRSVHVR